MDSRGSKDTRPNPPPKPPNHWGREAVAPIVQSAQHHERGPSIYAVGEHPNTARDALGAADHADALRSPTKMDRRVPIAATLLSLAACSPPLDPAWLVTEPREIALEVEMTAQGPYGERVGPSSRSFRDGLPGDTLSLQPVIIDAAGPLNLDELEGAWWLCSGVGNCLLRSDVASRPACTGDEIQPAEPCRIGDGGRTTLTLADLPTAELLGEQTNLLELVSGPTVAFMASPPDGPGLEACIARVDARQRLDGCLMMERTLGIGPLGELVALVESLGIATDVPTGDTLLSQPRNRNPAVLELSVSYGGETVQVPVGTRLSVPRGQDIVLAVVTGRDDLDAYEVIIDEQTIMFADELGTQWWFDEDIERADLVPGQQIVSWRGDTSVEEVRAYVALRDSRGGEAWGWLDFELRG